MSDKPVLNVWCLSDGRPGHFNQSKGLLQALELGYQLELSWIEVSLRLKPLRKLLRALLNRAPGSAGLVERCYQAELPAGTPDLIISTGGNTAFLNAALAQRFSCQNYFIGSLRGLTPTLFSKVLTIEPIGSDNNIVMPLAPVPSDRPAQQQAADELRQSLNIPAVQPLWTLLIGGSTDQYRFSDQDWQALAQQMNQLARAHNIRWLVTSSRRTGIEIEQQLSAALESNLLADTTWYCQQPRKVMAAYLGAAEVVFCTEDSLSMLTEGIASGKPVIALQPGERSPDQRYAAALERLVDRGWLQQQPMAEMAAPGQQYQAAEPPAQVLWHQLQN